MWIKPYSQGFPSGSVVKNPSANAGDPASIPGSGRSPGGHGNPLQYSCLENPTDRGAWQATAQVVANSQTRLQQLSTAQQVVSLPSHHFSLPSPFSKQLRIVQSFSPSSCIAWVLRASIFLKFPMLRCRENSMLSYYTRGQFSLT